MSNLRKSTQSSEDVYSQLQSIIRENLNSPTAIHRLRGVEVSKREVLILLTRTITMAESNSLLLIGPRGSGKSSLLRSVLAEVESDKNVTRNFMQVHLNGLLQTDDRIAIKEITHQLKLENVVGDKVFGSFAENLCFLLEALKSGDQHSKTILVVLDEFDAFCEHHNQSLLYNLFDVAQSAQTPIAVIGLTCRFDAIELLEKRVKSRFSHRQVHLFPNLSFDDYIGVASDQLLLRKSFDDRKFRKEWNKSIKAVMIHPTVTSTLKRLYSCTKDLRTLKTFLALLTAQINSTHPKLEHTDFPEVMKFLSHDSKALMLHGVSCLELCLIIAMKRLTDIYDGEPFNFEMVYREYQKLSSRVAMTSVRSVIMKAFEHLQTLEVVQPAEGISAAHVPKEFRLMMLLVESSQLIEVLERYPNISTEIKQWASSVA